MLYYNIEDLQKANLKLLQFILNSNSNLFILVCSVLSYIETIVKQKRPPIIKYVKNDGNTLYFLKFGFILFSPQQLANHGQFAKFISTIRWNHDHISTGLGEIWKGIDRLILEILIVGFW